ncbi:hypothetical protein HELRODRAFT_148163, partial [Helobdella robusta]|uniref:RING-type domain-containing protein n=1 Tax=Helobdella robusta TaxID=6412 RepID=T1EK59_HELRO
CVVGLEEFHEGQFVQLLPCKHSFHHSCLHEWTRITTKCPTCRKILVIRLKGF